MLKLKLAINCTILVTTSTLLAYPPNNLPQVQFQMRNYCWQFQSEEWVRPNTYDEIMQMLEDLESGELERRYSPVQLEKVNDYLTVLAKEGILPNEFEEEISVEEDAYDLMYGEDSAFQLMQYLENSSAYMIIPAVLNDYSGYSIMQCGKISHSWKKTKKFVKKHKKAIIIGAVVVVTVAAVTVAVVVASSAAAASAAAGAAGAAGAAASSSGSSSSSSTKPECSGNDASVSSQPKTSNETPIFKSVLEERISAFKVNLSQENFFGQFSANGEGLSLEEIGRVVGPLFAHDSFNNFNDHLANYPQFSQEIQNIASQYNFSMPPGASDNAVGYGHNEIDKRFASNYGSMFSDPAVEVHFNALSYQMRGEAARSRGYYEQAVNDFSKAININPADPMPHLQRGISYFDMGQYDRAIEDFNNFATQIAQTPEKIQFSTPEFTLGFAKGLPKGVYESGEGIILFLGDLITHPIHTAAEMYDALSTLAKLARNDEWGLIGEALSPEVYQLVTEWDTLPSVRRGELAGYAFGKHGADILTPGAIAKIACKSVKAAQELTVVLKNLQRAEGTLILEAAAGVGNSARAGEMVNAGRTTIALGEDIGLTASEMGHLKKVGKLEETIHNGLEKLVSQSESEAYLAAKNGGKHAPLIRKCSEQTNNEIQKSIKSLEKQIVKHQDKIVNPANHYPDWHKLDPRQREALINRKWPAEIQCFTEERDILQSVLNQRVKN